MSPLRSFGWWSLFLLGTPRPGRVQGQNASSPSTCTESCLNANCVQSNFTQCIVECDNTGVTAVVGTCQSAIFDDASTVTCKAGACRGATFAGQSTVECAGVDSCGDITMLQSTATCHQGTGCGHAHFYSSAVACESCPHAAFTPCSCCDGYCAGGTPSCIADTLGFCSSTYLGRNCQEWGNPACTGLTLVTTCENGSCQGQAFADTGVLCENRNGVDTCKQTNFTNTLVDCNGGACADANFIDSTAQCYNTIGTDTGSCNGATAIRSSVHCAYHKSDAHQAVCDAVDFFSSAVECVSGACANSWFRQCSCCDGSGCHRGVPSCTNLPQEFCSTKYAGLTCKEWGNPACKDVTVEETGVDVTFCTQGDCGQAVYTDAAIVCDNADFFGAPEASTCHSIDVTRTAMACEAGACQAAQITDSTVTCQKTKGDPSCVSATVSQSTVQCWDESCGAANFTASAVYCDATYSCGYAAYDACTCCDGWGCRGKVSCKADLTSFCASCVGRGNPLCEPNSTATVTATGPMATMGTIATAVAAPTLSPVVATATTNPTTATPSIRGTVAAVTMAPMIVPATESPVTEAPVAQTSMPATKAPNATTPMLETVSNTPVNIPSIAGANETLAIVGKPQNGNLIAQADGSLTYTPNDGYQGEDSFDVQVCDANQQCEVTTLVVVVVQPLSGESNKSNEKSSDNTVYYCLTLLALVPIAAISVYMYQQGRRRGDSANDGSHPNAQKAVTLDQTCPPSVPSESLPKNDATQDPATMTLSTTANMLVEEEPITPLPQQVSYRSIREDDNNQPQQQPRVTTLSAIDVQRAQMPKASPATSPDAKHLPDHKDQCRSVVRPSLSGSDPHQPIANAVLIPHTEL